MSRFQDPITELNEVLNWLSNQSHRHQTKKEESMRLPCLIGFILATGFTAPAVDSAGFTLHEWGTFTSISGSDGVLLPGLEREPLSGGLIARTLDLRDFYNSRD